MLSQIKMNGESDDQDYIALFDLLTRLNERPGLSAETISAPTTAPSTAVAVPALRCHAAEDPQTVAVVAPTLLQTLN